MARRHNVHPDHPDYPPPSRALAAAIRELEAARKSRVFLLVEGVHPARNGISACTYADVRRAVKDVRVENLDLLVSSNGGSPEEAFKIARLLQNHSRRFCALVPEHAKSAATMICLGAREIVMAADAELGPIDMQIQDSRQPEGWISSLQEFKGLEAVSSFCHMFLDATTSVVRYISQRSMSDSIEIASAFVSPLLRPLFEQVDPRTLGGFRRALEENERYAERLLAKAGYSREVAARIVHGLVYHYPSHGFVIHVDEASEMGLLAVPPKNAKIEALMDAILDEAPEEGYIGFPLEEHRPRAKRGTTKRAAKKATNGAGTHQRRTNGATDRAS